MELDNIEQLTAEFIEKYRTELGLSLDRFWGAVGISAPRGYRYETEANNLPDTVKRLLFLQYGVGIPTDCQSEDFLNFAAAMRQSNPFKVGQAAKLIREAHHLLVGEMEDRQ